MQLTVQDIISDAMGIINAIAINEIPTLAELNLGLRTLNVMVDRWSANRILLHSTVSESFSLTPGKSTYTISASGTADITSPKPIKIISAFLRYTNNNEDILLEIRDKKELDAYSDKFFARAAPEVLFYDPGMAQQSPANIGTITLYPTPDTSSTYSVFITSDKYMTEFVNITDTINFDPAYYEALIYNLAVRLYRKFHTNTSQIPGDILLFAKESLDAVYRYSIETFNSSVDLPKMCNYPSSGGYNIYIGR